MYWCTSVVDRIRRYYLNTWVKIPESTGLVHVNKVNNGNVILKNINGDVFEINLMNGYNLEFTLPVNRIYFQSGLYAYLMVRYPSRQYYRGYSDLNTQLYKLCGEGGLEAASLRWEILNALTDKAPYLFPKEAAQQPGAWKSIALTHRLAMTKAGLLFLDDVVVGKYDRKKDHVVCPTRFSGILKDYLQHTHTTVVIKDE